MLYSKYHRQHEIKHSAVFGKSYIYILTLIFVTSTKFFQTYLIIHVYILLITNKSLWRRRDLRLLSTLLQLTATASNGHLSNSTSFLLERQNFIGAIRTDSKQWDGYEWKTFTSFITLIEESSNARYNDVDSFKAFNKHDSTFDISV